MDSTANEYALFRQYTTLRNALFVAQLVKALLCGSKGREFEGYARTFLDIFLYRPP